MTDRVVERQALFKHAVKDGGRERRVARRKPCGADRLVDHNIRIAFVLRHGVQGRKRSFPG